MTQTQKQAALTAFENMTLYAKEVADEIAVGNADNVEIDNDVAGRIIHAERVIQRLRDYFLLGRPIGKDL